jgi:tripartite-type tricarboxylate transporter receptor subunit TctC
MARVLVLVASLLFLAAGNASAQGSRASSWTLICPFPAGGGIDEYFRTLAQGASKHLGQAIGVVNQPGEEGTRGLATVAQVAPDGSVLTMLPITAFRLPHLQRVSWNPVKDFTYVIALAAFTFGIVVKSDSQFKTLQDLVDFAKANPGTLRFGAPFAGSTPHLIAMELGMKTGSRFVHVHGRGQVMVMDDLMAGRVLAAFDSSGAWGSRVDSGALRLLATFGERRSRWNVPTALELGLGILSYSPFGVVGPKGMDAARTKALHDAFNRALDDPDYDKLLRRVDMVDWYKSGEDYADWAIDQFEFQRELLKRTIGLPSR